MALVLLCNVPRVPYQLLEVKGLKIEKCSVYLSLSSNSQADQMLTRTEALALVDKTSVETNRWFSVGLTVPARSITARLLLRVWITTDSTSSNNNNYHAANNSTAVIVGQCLINVQQQLLSQLPPSTSSSFFSPPITITTETDIAIKLVRDCRPQSWLPGTVYKQTQVLESTVFHHSIRTACRETCFEVPFAMRLSQSYLEQSIQAIQSKLNALELVHKQALITQGYVAGEGGFSLVQFRVESIINLVQTQQRARQTTTLSSPFVMISLRDKSGQQQQRMVGRTNTEYRTANPQFGSNANMGLAEHSNPALYAQADRFGRLVMVNGAICFETNMCAQDELIFQVLHERHSVRDAGLTSELMCVGTLSFSKLLTHYTQQQQQQQAKITLLDQFNAASGVLVINAKMVKSSTAQASPTQMVRIPPYWLESKVCKPLKQQISQLKQMCQIVDKFKPSVKKSDPALAAFTTNLHQLEFTVEEGKPALLTTTCGVPSAIALPATQGLKATQLVQVDLIRQCTTLEGGSEEEFKCPCIPPCSHPTLNLDRACGNAMHLTNLSRIEPNSSTSLFRSAAASMVSKFNTLSMQQPTSVTPPQQKANEKSTWQLAYEKELDFRFREILCVSQALPSIASNVLAELSKQRSDSDSAAFGAQLCRVGYLIGWESLVTSLGAELVMLQDVRGVVDWLNANLQMEVCCNGNEWEVSLSPPATTLSITMPNAKFRKMFTGGKPVVKLGLVNIVLFSQGVNEKQSLANVMNKDLAAVHSTINLQSVQQLLDYTTKLGNPPSVTLQRLTQLVMLQRTDEKEVEVLWCAEHCIRELNGGMQIMCKSGKDRTAMAVTLEQAKAINLASNELQLYFANLLREFGVRIQIATKNIGRGVYSFNSIQRMALPKEYRPPTAVIQDLKTSYWNQNS